MTDRPTTDDPPWPTGGHRMIRKTEIPTDDLQEVTVGQSASGNGTVVTLFTRLEDGRRLIHDTWAMHIDPYPSTAVATAMVTRIRELEAEDWGYIVLYDQLKDRIRELEATLERDTIQWLNDKARIRELEAAGKDLRRWAGSSRQAMIDKAIARWDEATR